jgi:hypothetical protein
MEKLTIFSKIYFEIFSWFWVFAGPVTYFFDNIVPKRWDLFIYVVIGTFLLSIIKLFLSYSIKYEIPSLGTKIELKVGDLLKEKKSTIVIPVNDVFDTNLGQIISPDSVQGQFTNKYYLGDIPNLDSDIQVACRDSEKYAIYDEDKKYGKNKRYPLGTTISLGHSQKFFLTVVAKMENDHKKVQKVLADDLWITLSQLWDFTRNNNSLDPISLPIIGSGRGRSSVNTKTLIKMIILSFYSKSKEEKISNHITIYLHNLNIFDNIELQKFIKTLK